MDIGGEENGTVNKRGAAEKVVVDEEEGEVAADEERDKGGVRQREERPRERMVRIERKEKSQAQSLYK